MLNNPVRSDRDMMVAITRNLLLVAREKVLAKIFVLKAQHGLERSDAYIEFWVDLDELIDGLEWLHEELLMSLIDAFGPVDDDDDEALWSLVESKNSLTRLLAPPLRRA